MAKHCCGNCVYATQAEGRWHRVMMRRFPTLRLCFNSVDAPGRMHEVRVEDTCPNFRLRFWPKGQRGEPPKPRDDKVRYIPLAHGLYAIVDAEDHEWLSQYKWSPLYSKHGKIIYATRSVVYEENGKRRRKSILMHREIMKPPEGMVVDHINGNGLNNRHCNLRNCTQAQNMQNHRPRTDGQSRFIGVFPYGDKWRARINSKGKQHHIGTFETQIAAALARDHKALELFGEFARLNFPEIYRSRRQAET